MIRPGELLLEREYALFRNPVVLTNSRCRDPISVAEILMADGGR
jgi:hypothetical protein